MATISGVVRDSTNAPTKRLVRLHRRDTGAFVGQAYSDPSTGAYSITTSYAGEHYAVVHDTNSGDYNWSKVSLACHFNGTNNSTTFTDEVGATITRIGTPVISTAQYKFGGSSALFNGTTDGLSVPNASNLLILGGGDFTVEAWIFLNTLPTSVFGAAIVCLDYNINGWLLRVAQNGQGVQWVYPGLVAAGPTTTLSTNSWYHVSACREGTQHYVSIGGTVTSLSMSNRTTDYTGPLVIGADGYFGTSAYFDGYIDDLRITKGLAKYTANFSPETQEFPNTAASDGTENALILDRLVPV